MERQPARINYFFGECYGDLGRTIKNGFCRLGKTISDLWFSLATTWGDLLDDFEFGPLLLTLIKTAYYLACLISTAVITTSVVTLFSLVHIIIVAVIMFFIYLWFSFLWILDVIMCRFRKIVSSCPQCQYKFALPYYQCPGCGKVHTKLMPSKYGILKRTCECGRRLPTTFFNGRQKLDAICPKCGYNLKGGGFQVNISIPVLGGPSSGKTCFISMALNAIEKESGNLLGYNFEHIEQGTDNLKTNLLAIENGRLPDKTSEMRLMYYEFYFSPFKSKVRNQISLCDVAGEVYRDSAMDSQVGYGYANAFLMILDPLTIPLFRREAEKQGSVEDYFPSSMPIDEILDKTIKMLENMRNISSKQKIDRKLAIVFTKCDLPLLNEKIGEKAQSNELMGGTRLEKMEICNKLCEQFLLDYEQAGFVNIVKSKFTKVQYFTCSALGHNADGTPFNSTGVIDPVLWLIDKESPTIDFKKYWSA